MHRVSRHDFIYGLTRSEEITADWRIYINNEEKDICGYRNFTVHGAKYISEISIVTGGSDIVWRTLEPEKLEREHKPLNIRYLVPSISKIIDGYLGDARILPIFRHFRVFPAFIAEFNSFCIYVKFRKGGEEEGKVFVSYDRLTYPESEVGICRRLVRQLNIKIAPKNTLHMKYGHMVMVPTECSESQLKKPESEEEKKFIQRLLGEEL